LNATAEHGLDKSSKAACLNDILRLHSFDLKLTIIAVLVIGCIVGAVFLLRNSVVRYFESFDYNPNNAIITLSKSGCYGDCHAHTITAYASNGTVIHQEYGKSGEKIIYITNVTSERIKTIAVDLANIGFFSLKEDYCGTVFDAQTIKTTLSTSGNIHSVCHLRHMSETKELEVIDSKIENLLLP